MRKTNSNKSIGQAYSQPLNSSRQGSIAIAQSKAVMSIAGRHELTVIEESNMKTPAS